MTINNILQRLKQVKAYDSTGTQTIIEEQFAKDAISLLDANLLSNPDTTYLDPQCGSGTLMLYLASQLMTSLEKSIPNEIERIEHIFTKQLFASDIDDLQTLVCNTNFKKSLNNKTFNVNVEKQDFSNIYKKYDVVVSAVDFSTTNEFVNHFKKLTNNLLVLTRPNKNRYTKSHIHEITKYKFLGVTKSTTPICAMLFTNKNNKKVEFISGDGSVVIDNPKYLPGTNLKSYVYVKEILNNNFETFKSNYGSYYINNPKVVNNPGNVQLIYQVGGADQPFRKTVGVDQSIITPREGVGVHKVVISKNGNRSRKSVLKYAGPEYGTGHNAIWIQTKDKKEAEEIINYYNSPEITTLVLSLSETSPANGVGFWAKIPHYRHREQVKEIYAKYFN